MNEQSDSSVSSHFKAIHFAFLIVLTALLAQAWMQYIGLRQSYKAVAANLEQSQKALKDGEAIRSFAESFFKDVVSLASSNANAAKIQKQFNIQYKGEAPLASTPVQAPTAPPSSKK